MLGPVLLVGRVVESFWRRICSLLAMIIPLTLSGCSSPKTYPVEGQVIWLDSKKPAVELAGYTVSFECPEARVSATGDVDKEGKFRLSTFTPSDGAVPGKHRVALTPPDPYDVDKPRPKALIHRDYHTFDTSKITVEVERKLNEITISVGKSKPR